MRSITPSDCILHSAISARCSSRINTPCRRSNQQPDPVHSQGRTPILPSSDRRPPLGGLLPDLGPPTLTGETLLPPPPVAARYPRLPCPRPGSSDQKWRSRAGNDGRIFSPRLALRPRTDVIIRKIRPDWGGAVVPLAGRS